MKIHTTISKLKVIAVNIDIWQIPEKLEDCRYIESIKKTLKSRIVDLLSRELMRQVEVEGHLHRDLLILDRILEGIDPETEGLFQSIPVDDLVEFKEVADVIDSNLGVYVCGE
ncbi:hypothetical protein HK103_001093 [Boothiomyces macroporosus]|uniref:Uncharacterized protein n=1 Tax=Boothiomyces macroporosus TaxID=261099 RepID=A0AAD5UB25_9FUNG|nr:hypothetical protein HK103_001093 [Boothiomyces macroporosus]